MIQVHPDDEILNIEILPGKHQPYWLENHVYVRNGSESIKASSDRIQKMINLQQLDLFDQSVAEKQALTFEYVKSIFRQKEIEFKPKALGFLNSEQNFTNTALLMSDQNPFSVKMAVFYGTNVMEFKDRKEVSGSLLRQLDVALEYMDLNNSVRMVITGKPQRDEYPSYPVAAIRETFINAISHRSYFSKSPVQVEFFDDRMSVMSPGPIPDGLEIKAIIDGQTRPRNPNVVSILHRLGYIENHGTGMRRILSSYEQENVTPEIIATEDFVKITLPNLNYVQELVDPMLYKNDNPKIKIIEYLSEHENVTRSEVENLLQVSRSQAGNYLKKLLENNVIEKLGANRATTYRLKNPD
ncbi:ATP-binding protein [Xylocopilactobacillus apicola]|uniref:ATPase AAA n=1 Tax=Xylocopilactobacillus apicola TaxID=2932184 RepID=A0AAU9DRI5_9LACO|nr:ATP-binding protein [Xylocopilactobacillus apicola]BDR57788.1 ATPase AAA [Xylocopilactobacillus apicola]